MADTYNSTIRKITPVGIVSTVAGLAENTGSADGIGSNARFYWPSGVAVDATGNLYVADTYNCTIRKITNGAKTGKTGDDKVFISDVEEARCAVAI